MVKKGFSLIELLLAGALFSLASWGMAAALMSALSTGRLAEETALATAYAQDGIEVLRSIKARDFTALAATEGSGLSLSGGEWSLSGSEDKFEKYRRTVALYEVERDGNGDIVESGGDIDPDTLRVVSTVRWNVTTSREDSVTLETYLTRLR